VVLLRIDRHTLRKQWRHLIPEPLVSQAGERRPLAADLRQVLTQIFAFRIDKYHAIRVDSRTARRAADRAARGPERHQVDAGDILTAMKPDHFPLTNDSIGQFDVERVPHR